MDLRGERFRLEGNQEHDQLVDGHDENDPTLDDQNDDDIQAVISAS